MPENDTRSMTAFKRVRESARVVSVNVLWVGRLGGLCGWFGWVRVCRCVQGVCNG